MRELAARTLVTIRWRVGSRALERARVDAGDGDATLCWRVALSEGEGNVVGSEAVLIGDAGMRELASADGDGDAVRDADHLHIEVPGLLSATLAGSGRSARLLYARTTLLEALGIPPGTYEPDGCDVATETG